MILSKPMYPAVYRVYQFFVAVKAGLPEWAGGVSKILSSNDATLVQSILPTDSQQNLFAQMPPNDQRHAIAVARSLQQANYNNPALLQAALLHDVAKSMGQPIIHRVLIVLFETFWPAALHRLSAGDEWRMTNDGSSANSTIRSFPWWRRPFVVHAHHAAIGAVWAQRVGCNPPAVRLIRRHQDKLAENTGADSEQDKLLTALQWADDLN